MDSNSCSYLRIASIISVLAVVGIGVFTLRRLDLTNYTISRREAIGIAQEHLNIRGHVVGSQIQSHQGRPIWYVEVRERRGFLPRHYGVFVDATTGGVLRPNELLNPQFELQLHSQNN
jgi:predicted small secreted protein